MSWNLKLFLVPLLLGSGALAGCSGIALDRRVVEEGIFVLNSRDVKPRSTVISEGETRPAPLVPFKDLQDQPALRFRGRLTTAGGHPKGDGKYWVKNVRPLEYGEFHGVNASGPVPGEPTFAELVDEAESLVIYVHGFNNSPSDPAELAQLLKRQLALEGRRALVMFYTWPTRDRVGQVVLGGALSRATFGVIDSPLKEAYFEDRKGVNLAAHALYQFFEEVADEYPRLKIDVVAHSLGSEVSLTSLFFWNFHRLKDGQTRPEELRIVRRLVLVGADIGLPTFRILTPPANDCAEQILVYVNPGDEVLREAGDLNLEPRLGVAELDEPLPGIPERFTFVKLQEPPISSPQFLPRFFLVNHNPLLDRRVLGHVCQFLATGEVAANTEGVRIQPLGASFRGTDADYYSLEFEGTFVDAFEVFSLPVRRVPQLVRTAGGIQSAGGE